MVALMQPANVEGNNETLGDYSAIPPGKYVGVITKSEYKETKAKDGHYLQLTIKVTEGKHKGKVLFERLNLDNPNPVAVEIANKAVNTICQACELFGVEDSEELHGIPMVLTVTKTKATNTQPEGNEIKFYEKFTGDIPTNEEVSTASSLPFAAKPAPATVQGAAVAQQPAAQPAAKPAAKKMPWEK